MDHYNTKKLIESLKAIHPLELEAVSLLQTLRPQTGEWFPTRLTPEAKTQVVAATVELVGYSKRSADMARRLAHLQPVPLKIPMAEFGL